MESKHTSVASHMSGLINDKGLAKTYRGNLREPHQKRYIKRPQAVPKMSYVFRRVHICATNAKLIVNERPTARIINRANRPFNVSTDIRQKEKSLASSTLLLKPHIVSL